MGLHHLDHYTIESANLDATRRFYCDLLGLKDGERPPLPFPGLWLYCENDKPTVHVMGSDRNEAERGGHSATGVFHHISFVCTGAEGIRARLERAGIPFKVVVLPGFGNTQFFMRDPDGVAVELNFPPSETRQSDVDAMSSAAKADFLL